MFGRLVFKQLPRDQANVNAWKNMCDPYIKGYDQTALTQRLICVVFGIQQKQIFTQHGLKEIDTGFWNLYQLQLQT